MSRLKVMTIVGTRPEIIRLSRVIDKCGRYFDHTLVHTGQNYDYELNQVFFKELDIRAPDIFLEAAGKTAMATIAQVIERIDRVLTERAPDAVLILGDTNSALSAIAAKRQKIPIFHMEAGNRCFDFRVPEEINRRIVDHISDINLTYSQIAREYLLREGLPPAQIICTGSPMQEIIQHYRSKIDASDVLSRLKLTKDKYFLVSCHREENVDNASSLGKLIEVIRSLRQTFGLPVLVSTHPRTRTRLDAAGFGEIDGVIFHKPFGFPDYVRLQLDAKAVLSDSGTISEESSILNFRALNIREMHERPEGMEEGAVMMVGMDAATILSALAILEDQPTGSTRGLNIVNDYDCSNVSDKIVRIIQSYTGYVNRVVWRKT
jgi:UDP-N-acetylglucosamine 2-epimerase